MVAFNSIEELSQRIAGEFHPERIILFGSYARGTASGDSDVDLLVIMDHDRESVDKEVEIRLRTRPPFPVDILVRSPKVLKKRLKMGDSFLRHILDEGLVLYEADHAGVGR